MNANGLMMMYTLKWAINLIITMNGLFYYLIIGMGGGGGGVRLSYVRVYG